MSFPAPDATPAGAPQAPHLRSFIAGLPKVELHVHHVGSALPEVVAQLAARHPGTVPADPQALRDFFTFRDFDHFIEVYLATVALIRTPEDVETLTWGVAQELARQNVRYAELTCTPYTSVLEGIPIEGYVEAIESARVRAAAELNLDLAWIFDIPGEIGPDAPMQTARIAVDHGPSALIGFGLGGPEVGSPRPKFKPAFDLARAAGLRSVPHAGETTGPQAVWDALDVLGAERIGHGIGAAQDEALLARLAATGVPLEVCPTSNVATRAVSDYPQHPLRQLVEAGVTVTVNSDDPPMFSTTLNREYEVAAALLGLDETGVADLAVAAVDASFLSDPGKQRLRGEIAGYLAEQLAPAVTHPDPPAV